MKAKVLLVDDEPQVLKALERLLRRDGYDMLKAGNGEEALELLSRHEIAVMLCDERMPGMPGTDVLSEARSLSPDTVRIVLTACGSVETLLKCINEGQVTRFLMKPWNDEAMRRVVNEAVSQHWMATEVRRLGKLTEAQHVKLQRLTTELEKDVRERTTELRQVELKLERLGREVVTALLEMIGLHAPWLGMHAKRVAQTSVLLAEKAGEAFEEVLTIESAALLHDIGKLAVPACVLDRQGAEVSEKDRRALQRHPIAGHALLSEISGFEKVATLVRHHHEAVSGKGYPDGLANEDIPAGARIIAVADAYDHQVHLADDMPGSLQKAEESLRRMAGDTLDQNLVNVFLESVIMAETRQ